MKRRRALLFTAAVVLILCGAFGVWLYVQRQQYARNRQLIAALKSGDTDTALALVNAGADLNTRFVPLPAPTLKLLLDHLLHSTSPPVNDSPTAFMYACGTLSITQLNGRIVVASMEENLPLLQAMLAHHADVRARAYDSQTALHWAVVTERLHTAELLVQHGADVNALDSQQRTPLLWITRNTRVEIVRLLLSHSANPNVEDNYGHTALYYAVEGDFVKGVIRELLAHGADPNLSSPYGLTPLQAAKKNKRSDLIRLLTQGAK